MDHQPPRRPTHIVLRLPPDVRRRLEHQASKEYRGVKDEAVRLIDLGTRAAEAADASPATAEIETREAQINGWLRHLADLADPAAGER